LVLSFGLTLFLIAGCGTPDNNGSNTFISADVVSAEQTGRGISLATLQETATDASQQAVRAIEEADVVKLIGQTLYVLNHDRGLRVIDVADWSKPTLKGSFSFTGEPIEMYVTNNVGAIIVQNYSLCRLDAQAQPEKQSGSKIYMVDVSNPDSLTAIDTFEIDGYVSETRRVGDVIYLAGRNDLPYWGGYMDDTSNGFVASVYVADPQNVHLVEQKDLPGQGEYIHAAQNAIFVAGFDWNTDVTTIQYVDITDPAGKIVLRGSCQVNGHILNRFSLDADNGTLRVVAEQNSWLAPQNGVTLFTFDLGNPDDIQALGDLAIIQNETLRAVRFDGLKAYVVTFEQRDPLWVINLSNPALPTISGYLEAPGYSTYLQSDGNRLVAVGINDIGDWRPSVMLYDVSDPANPKELDRAVLGQRYATSSVANFDEKAFTVIPEAHLILVPFNTWQNGSYKDELMMLDYSADNLTELATIEHRGAAIRSGVDLASNVLWVLSQKALQTLNIVDRKSPQQLAMLGLAENILAWKVTGQYGLRLVLGNDDYTNPAVNVQVLAASDPNGTQILAHQTFNILNPNLMIVDGGLAVLTGINNDGSVKVVTLDISSLPNLTITADKDFDFRLEDWWGGPYLGGVMMDSVSSSVAMPWINPIPMPCWQSDQNNPLLLANRGLVFITAPTFLEKQLKIISLADPADPKIASTVDINDGSFDMVLQVGAAGNTVFSTVGQVVGKPLLSRLVNGSDKPNAAYHVQLIDCSDLSNPKISDPVNVPGITVGLRDDFVFTVDPQWTDTGLGIGFHSVRITNGQGELVSSVDLPEGAPGTVHFAGNAAILAVGNFYSFGYGYAEPAVQAQTDDCNLGSFNLVSINIADPANLVIATNDQYAGNGQIADIVGSYVISQTTYSGQALIWKLADNQTLTLNKVVDMPSQITDVTTSDGTIDLACGPAGVIAVTPNP